MEPNIKFIELRKSKNLSQVEFAQIIGVSQGTIGDIERGRIGISKNVKSKIIEKFDIEAGYFDSENQERNIELKQGIETGWRQGFENNSTQYAKDKIEKFLGKPKKVNALNLTDQQILSISANKKSNVYVQNITPERQQALLKLFDKQKVIAEKVLNSLANENTDFDEFRNAILAIQSFENLLNNIIDCRDINRLIKIEDSAKNYPMVIFSDFKATLNADFLKIKPYAHIFSDLAKAMKTFANKALEIPNELIGIDEQEFTEYIALNSKN